MGVRYFKEVVKDIFYPKDYSCVFCKWPLEKEYLCIKCRDRLIEVNGEKHIKIENEILNINYIFLYSGYAVELIQKLKYKGDFRIGEICAEYIHNFIKSKCLEDIDYITYVPMHKVDERKRKYNQCKVISKYISDYYGIDMIDTLIKTKRTKDQIGLSKNQRFRNLENVFRVKENLDIKNKTILIIDDVCTTGSTLYYCKKELQKMKPKEIIILTVCAR